MKKYGSWRTRIWRVCLLNIRIFGEGFVLCGAGTVSLGGGGGCGGLFGGGDGSGGKGRRGGGESQCAVRGPSRKFYASIFRPLFDHSQTTVADHFGNFSTTFRPLFEHISTAFQPHLYHISIHFRLSRWLPFSQDHSSTPNPQVC